MQRVQIGQQGTSGLCLHAELFMAIGRANDMSLDVAHNSSYVIAFGFHSDIETTRALHASLAVQLVRGSDDSIKNGD
jgi:hypothetical protein